MLKKYLIIGVVSLIVLVIFEVVWNVFIFSGFYAVEFQNLANMEDDHIQTNLLYASLFWIIFIIASVYYLTSRLPNSSQIRFGFIHGIVLGYLILGNLHLFNLALFRGYSLSGALVDISRAIVIGAIIGPLIVWLHKKL